VRRALLRSSSLRGGLLLPLLLLFAPIGGAAVAQGERANLASLQLEVSPWTLPSRPLQITVSQSGILAGRRLAIFLFVDGNQFERITTRSDRTETSVVLPAIGPGRHVLVARCGTEVAEAEFRVVPWPWAFGILLLMALAVGLGVRAMRRR
jgi:hypothetical protein